MRECIFLFLWAPVSAGNIFRITRWKTIIYTPRWNMHSIVYPTQYTCDFVESCYIVFFFNSWGFGISVWVTLKWKWCYIHKMFITDYTELVILTKFNGASDYGGVEGPPHIFFRHHAISYGWHSNSSVGDSNYCYVIRRTYQLIRMT